jgi:hypothetical protein
MGGAGKEHGGLTLQVEHVPRVTGRSWRDQTWISLFDCLSEAPLKSEDRVPIMSCGNTLRFAKNKESLGGEGHRASDYERKFDARAGIAGAEFNGNLEETTKCLLLNSPSAAPHR